MKFNNQKTTKIRSGLNSLEFTNPESTTTCLPAYPIAVMCMLLLLLPQLSFGQGYIEGVNVSYEHLPMKIKTEAGDQNFTGSNFKIATTIPIFLTPNKSRYLLVGGNLEAFSFSGTHSSFEVKTVYSISPTVGYTTMVNKNFNLTGLFMPFLNSDYKNVKASDIKFGAVVRGTWKVSDKLTWKAIVGYRRQFYGPQYIVLAGMDWKVNDKLWIFGDLPHSATVSYAVNKKVNTGFNLFVQNSTYRLNNQQRYFEYNTVNPGLFAEYYISPNWAIRATAAYTLIRNMEVYNKNDKVTGFIDFYELGNRKDPLNPEVSGGLSFKVGLSYRIVPGKH